MRASFVVALFFLFCVSLQSQVPFPWSSGLDVAMNSSGKYVLLSDTYTDIDGSPYLKDDFIYGKLRINGVDYDSVSLRYDIHFGYFEIELDDAIKALRTTDVNVDTIYYSGEKFVRRMLSGELRFLVHLMELEDVSLCKEYGIRMTEAKQSNGYSPAQPAQLIRKSPVYYIFDGDNVVEITDVKSLAVFLDLEKKDLKNYLRQHKLKLSNESDLMELMRYYLY